MGKIANIEQVRSLRDREETDFVYAWPSSSLKPERPAQWLAPAVENNGLGDQARSIWAHYPNLRLATEKLALFLTPNWPMRAGGAILPLAIERAVRNVNLVMSQDDYFIGRITAHYLHGLVSCVADVAQMSICGLHADGTSCIWEYFSEPLYAFADRHGLSEVEVHRAPQLPGHEDLLGLRQHLLTRISTYRDTGLFEAYAPPFFVQMRIEDCK